jgi:lipopolysaccharide/colanic/teichoic acid biosynthesis glycosyltransferase
MTDLIDDTVVGENWRFDQKTSHNTTQKGGSFYLVTKRAFDVLVSCAAIPVFLVLCVIIYVLNHFWNPGPLFFRQDRMGKDQTKFSMVKFRTMLPENSRKKRGPFDGLEEWRITPFGRWMRKTRMDEVPQILNVIMGQMSLIGPRPEAYDFAQTYQKEIPGYQVRETVRPGITGYAQVTQGYTDSEEMVRVKTKLDVFYVRNMRWWLDVKVLLLTVRVIVFSHGAR